MTGPEIERLDGETVYGNPSFDVVEVESMIDGGSFVDATTVAAFHLFRRTLERERRESTDPDA